MRKEYKIRNYLQMDELAKYIGLEEAPQSWNIAFENIKRNIPNKIKWLDKKHAIKVLEYYNINDEIFNNKYLETLDMINANVYLKVLIYLWHYNYILIGQVYIKMFGIGRKQTDYLKILEII